MAAKITFIGAGSFGFTRTLVRDLLTHPRLADATLSLMDIDAARTMLRRYVSLTVVGIGLPRMAAHETGCDTQL